VSDVALFEPGYYWGQTTYILYAMFRSKPYNNLYLGCDSNRMATLVPLSIQILMPCSLWTSSTPFNFAGWLGNSSVTAGKKSQKFQINWMKKGKSALQNAKVVYCVVIIKCYIWITKSEVTEIRFVEFLCKLDFDFRKQLVEQELMYFNPQHQ